MIQLMASAGHRNLDIASLEAASGVKPQVIGKPDPIMFQLAREQTNAQPETMAVIGDHADTDIREENGLVLPQYVYCQVVQIEIGLELLNAKSELPSPFPEEDKFCTSERRYTNECYGAS